MIVKLKVPGDTLVSKMIWNSPHEPTKLLKKQSTNELSIKTWLSNDEDSDIVTSKNTNEKSSQEIDTEPSATSKMGPSQEPTGEPTMEPTAERPKHRTKQGSKMGTNPKINTKTKQV